MKGQVINFCVTQRRTRLLGLGILMHEEYYGVYGDFIRIIIARKSDEKSVFFLKKIF